jgi:hypothetical protein
MLAAWSKNPRKKPTKPPDRKIRGTLWGKAIFGLAIQARKQEVTELRNRLQAM